VTDSDKYSSSLWYDSKKFYYTGPRFLSFSSHWLVHGHVNIVCSCLWSPWLSIQSCNAMETKYFECFCATHFYKSKSQIYILFFLYQITATNWQKWWPKTYLLKIGKLILLDIYGKDHFIRCLWLWAKVIRKEIKSGSMDSWINGFVNWWIHGLKDSWIEWSMDLWIDGFIDS